MVDNDGDMLVDCMDPDCVAAPSCAGAMTEDNDMACSDMMDNDGDMLVDCMDPDCMGTTACP